MKKNLNFQLVKKLKVVKKKQQLLFLRTVLLNSSFISLSYNDALLVRATGLFKSSLSKRLKKNRFSSTEITTQCLLSWRTRSVYSFFNLSRISLRELSSFGLIKGLRKSSW